MSNTSKTPYYIDIPQHIGRFDIFPVQLLLQAMGLDLDARIRTKGARALVTVSFSNLFPWRHNLWPRDRVWGKRLSKVYTPILDEKELVQVTKPLQGDYADRTVWK